MSGCAPSPVFNHEPVMRDEIVAVFAPVPAGVVLDATLGGAGHSVALLESRPDLRVLGVDQDPTALAAARARLSPFGERAVTSRCRFDDFAAAMADHGVASLVGALFDLGVSSPQLDRAERGFSYRHDGPLDMRMDPDSTLTADTVVNTYEADELAAMIRRYSDERFAKRIAAAIVAARPIATTTALAAVVAEAIPAPARRTGGHPAKRTFQAIRIEVNEELAVLPVALDAAIARTEPGGRIAVLTYHSGEDRIVKERFRAASGQCECPPGLPCACGAIALVRRVRAPKSPTGAQAEANRRARSARLRVVERTEAPTTTSPSDHPSRRQERP